MLDQDHSLSGSKTPGHAGVSTALTDRDTIECELGPGGMATVYLAEV